MPTAILHDQHGARLAFQVELTPIYIRYRGNVFARQDHMPDLAADHYKLVGIYTVDDDMIIADHPSVAVRKQP